MAVTSGYFNSVDGDRVYSAAQMSEYFEGLISNGVYEKVGKALIVKAGEGMSVDVGSGRAIIDGRWLKNDSTLNLPITAANALLDRWTAVYIRLDHTRRYIKIDTKDGTPAAKPVKPTMNKDSNYIDLCLAYVYVKAGATSISQSNITDMRASNLCGWVTGIVKQVDTSELFLQWEQAYEEFYVSFQEWFTHLTDTLQVNTYIKQYRKQATFTGSAYENIEITPNTFPGYLPERSDIINVYVDGKLADKYKQGESEDSDSYDITWAGGNDHAFVVTLHYPISKPTKVEVVILKSVIGNPTEGGSYIKEMNILDVASSESSISVEEG